MASEGLMYVLEEEDRDWLLLLQTMTSALGSKRGGGGGGGACIVNSGEGLPLTSMFALVGEPVLGDRSARTADVLDLVGDMMDSSSGRVEGWVLVSLSLSDVCKTEGIWYGGLGG